MRRIKLSLASIEVEFADRELALKRMEEWAERGTRFPRVVFGPEGCGKTGWLKQSAVLLRELGFDVLYLNPIEKEVYAELGVEDVKKRIAEILREATDEAWARAVWAAVDLAKELIRAGRKKIAILADDVFQAIGLNKAAIYVKGLLGLIEYPPASYERIVAVVATSEGVTRREIGRHEWADLLPMWNMPREGFKQLYDQIPGEKPPFEEAWRVTGGNPRILQELYEARWDVEEVVRRLVERKRLAPSFVAKWRPWLVKAVEDPDALWSAEAPEELIDELEARNLIVYFLSERDPRSWAGEPPSERDLEIGVGKRVAWQTPLHREAVRRALGEAGRVT